MNILLHPITSSMFSEIGYDIPSRTLRVNFNGKLCDYANVTEQQYQNILTAPSAGKAFQPIKNNKSAHPFHYV